MGKIIKNKIEYTTPPADMILNGIGRWEKIVEWDLSSFTSIDVTLDLSPYNVVALLSGHEYTNIMDSTLQLVSDWKVGDTLVSYTPDSGGNFSVSLTKKSDTLYTLTKAYSRKRAILYGYRETAISDNDIKKVVDEIDITGIPDGGAPGQVLTKKTSGNGDVEWTTLDGTIQVDTIPVASEANEGRIYQYVGATTADYTNGYFYQCQEITPVTNPKTYRWVAKNVQEGGGGGTVPENIMIARAITGAGNVDIYSITGSSNEYTPVDDKVTMDLRVIKGGTYSDLPEFNILTAGAGSSIYSKYLATTDYVDEKEPGVITNQDIDTIVFG